MEMTSSTPPVKILVHDLVGHCLVATADIAKGTVICKEEAELSSKMLLSTIQYKKGLHVNLPVGGFIWRTQHMCSPNAYLLVRREGEGEQEGDKASVSLIATSDIQKGEHVGYDYNTSEVFLSRSFECGCESEFCHGKVGGFHFLDEDERNQLAARLGEHMFSPAVEQVWKMR